MRDLAAYTVDHQIEIAAPHMLGARVKRVEDPRLITGHGHYVTDVELPGMLHAAFVRSPEAHAVIRSIDVQAARELPGVVGVFTGEDLREATLPLRADAGYPTWQSSARSILAVDRVRFVGEAIVMIVAEDRYVAEDAASLVVVDLDALVPVMTMDQALAADVQPLHEGWTTGCYVTRTKESGDVDAAFADADHTLKLRMTTQRYTAVPMEGRAVVADYDPHDDFLTVWDSTQVPHLARTCISQHLRYPEHHLRVISPDVGGGFGLKCMVFTEEIAIPFAARALCRPVRWVEDRVENLTASAHARDARDDLEVAFNDDGEIVALKADIVIDSGAYSVWPFTASMELG
ncbi:MAG: xanthine dehydrogenase family protein molybdopterin-binding subunit, partial [Trebonia sp.]